MWRSPVAYTAGGRVVAGSNPVIPTKTIKPLAYFQDILVVFILGLIYK